MVISSKGRYALRVMVYLAVNHDGSFIPLKEISQHEELSQEHLVLINMHGKQEVKKPVLQVDCLAGFHLQAPYVSRSVMRSSFRIF